MVSKCHIEIRLLQNRRINIAVEMQGNGRQLCDGVDSPARALDVLRMYLAGDDQRSVTVVLRSGDQQMRAWTTHSSTLALYWTAAALSNAWNESTRKPPALRASVSRDSGPIRTRQTPDAQDADDEEHVA
jgi:hypothetical protein